MIVPLLVLWLCGYTLSTDVFVVIGRRGDATVLQCGDDPGDPLVGVIWRIYHSDSSQCLFSFAPHIRGGETYNNCSTRLTLITDISLTIRDTQISDEGNYTCEMSSTGGTFITTSILQVLAQPSVSLDINRAGSPECRAIGGFPAAEISWIPHSPNISTSVSKEPDGSWTVISTYRTDGEDVTCSVSHPTFVKKWNETIISKGSTVWDVANQPLIVFCIFLTLIALGIIFWKRKRARTCSKKSFNTSPPQQQQQDGITEEEYEPYAIYTEKENVLYSQMPRDRW